MSQPPPPPPKRPTLPPPSASSVPKGQIDISQLPSIKNGMTEQEEAMKRRKTCRFIEEVGRVLRLPRVAIATSMVMFHRFYAKHTFSEHDRFEVAVAAIVLAAKTEESPKKLNTVIEEAYKVKMRGMQGGRISQTPGASEVLATTSSGAIDTKGEAFLKLKERILLLERVILHTIGFELSIDHPYKFLVEQIKRLVHRRQVEWVDPSSVTGAASAQMSAMLNKMVQYAMNFANDSMQTSLCLQFGPQKIATACVYLSGHFARVQPTQNQSWLDLLQIDVESLASISVQIMELVADRKGAEQDTFDAIRKELDDLKLGEDDDGPDAKRARTG